MEFRLLGPVEVVKDGNLQAIVAGRQEIVLALLLLEANHVVSIDRLIDALWGDRPPRTSKSQVQITVSTLRQFLGDHDLIVTRPPGYLLRVDDEHLDLARFRSLVARGRRAAGEQRVPEAVADLRSALGLWRGLAMDGIQSEVIRSAATGLNEWRISVLQDCLDLELQLARHSDLIGELTRLVAEYPLNERFRAQLMLALYRSGRQADALETFRAGRDHLRAELGLDPGEELARLEHAILAKDPELDLPAGRPQAGRMGRPGAVPVPRQLPRTTADFTGRQDALGRITACLSGDAGNAAHEVPVVVLTGMGGAGKTALALRAAHLLRADFPDGQLFLQLRRDGRQSAAGLLEHLLSSVGIPPDAVPRDLGDRSAMYRSWLADRRVLIVIDGALSPVQVAPLLPGTHGCAAIVTSGQQLTGLEGASQILVGPLDEDTAYDLLLALLGERRVHQEEAAARELIRLCEGLPLALRIVAAKLAARPEWRIGHMVRQLADEERRLDQLDVEGASVRSTLSLAYDSLDGSAQRLFRRLSILGVGDFASWVAAPLLDQDFRSAEDLFHSLIASHLVENRVTEDGSVRFHLHDLVRIFAVERLAAEEPMADRRAALERLLGCWLGIATAAHHRVYGGDFGLLHGAAPRWPLPAELVDEIVTNPGEWFRKERSALIAAIYRAGSIDLDELCWDLAVTTATLFEAGCYSDDWQGSHVDALAVVRRSANKRGEAALLYSLGTLELGLDVAKAREHLEQSLKLFDEIQEQQGRALALVGLAFVDRLGGGYDSALANYEEAAAGFRLTGDRAAEAYALKTMAQIHTDWLNYDEAERLLHSSLAICAELATPRLTAQAQYELAELHMRRGDLAAAITTFSSALQQTRDSADTIGQAYALAGLGTARRKLGDLAPAETALAEALDLADNAGDRLLQGRVLINLAELDFVKGRSNLSLARADDAMRVLRELGAAGVWQARALELLGRLHERAGRPSIAEQAWLSATELVRGTDAALADQLSSELGRLQRGT